jgi:hypothetical protein
MTTGNRAGRLITTASISAFLAGVTWLPASAETAFDQLEVEQRGEITVEASWYPRTAKHTGQKDSFLHLEAKPEILVYGDTAEAQLQPRFSGGTSGAGQIDFREAHVSGRVGELDYLVGSTILFWGKVESYNPVDVVNALDYSRGLMRNEKRGAPMVRLSWPVGPGQVDLLAIDFVENIYPDNSLRERPALPVTDTTAGFSGGAARDDIATAARWSGYFGDIDLGISWFRGTGHAPRLLPQSDGTLKPDYSRITQLGLDIQSLHGDSAVKAELIHRRGQYDRLGSTNSYGAGVIGVEHNLYDLAGSGRDLVLIAEYARDERRGRSHSGFQNDLVLGGRWLWNDVEDTEILTLLSRDLDNAAQTLTVTADRRITDALSFEATVRWPQRLGRDPTGAALSRDSAIIASLTYSF